MYAFQRECRVTQEYHKLILSLHSLQSCTLYEIFTDESGRTANQTCRSYDEVIKRAAGHAMKNMEEFGRVVPTYSQLMSTHGEVNTTMNITIQ